jgi:hypothetical protein
MELYIRRVFNASDESRGKGENILMLQSIIQIMQIASKPAGTLNKVNLESLLR